MRAAYIFTKDDDARKLAGRFNAFTGPLKTAGVSGTVWRLGGEPGDAAAVACGAAGDHSLVHCPVDNAALPENELDILEALYREQHPELLIFAGEAGPLAARLSVRIGGGCLTNCRTAGADAEGLWIKRPVYNSHADAVCRPKERPLVLTVSKAGPVAEDAGTAGQPEITEYTPALKPYSYCRDRQMKARREKNPLEEAKLVLVGGRGLGSRENYARLKALAQAWGGACGCTRAAAINGWADVGDIIGQSGHVLRAELCIALGVSGAAPFMAGVGSVKTLVAVNSDPDAPVFAGADYGIVGDALEVLEAWEKQAEEQRHED